MLFKQNHKFSTKVKIIVKFLFVFAFLVTSLKTEAQKKYVIVIDAGHGGKDPGNLGNGYKEKNIALKVALAVGDRLNKNKDIKVIYTRKGDTYPPLWKRGEIANNAKADLFISIHCDSHTSNAYGAGTFVLGLRGNKKNLEIAKRENASIFFEEDYKERYVGFDKNSAESVIGLSLLQEENLDKSLAIAGLIQHNFAFKLKRNDRKVKQDNFQVLRETVMPSVLVELGFLTNKKEGKFLNSKAGQAQMSSAISDAVLNYVDNLKKNTVQLNTTPETTNSSVEFKVQIASSSRKVATKAYNFKGLKNIDRVKVGNSYKYYYGITSNYTDVKKSLEIAKKKGFSSAFVVAFKEGKKVSVAEVIKTN